MQLLKSLNFPLKLKVLCNINMYLKSLVNFCRNHTYLFIGIIIGIFFNVSLTDLDCSNRIPTQTQRLSDFNYSTIKTVLKTNVSRKSTKKPTQLVRPRYYSTELGMKEKLFIGVLTSEEKIATQASHINRTVEHLVDKIKFFITAQPKVKSKLNYTGLVGFTDTRHKYRPFQVVKYIADNFLQDYDYYFLMNDFDYLNAKRLMEIVGRISVSMNVYLGTPVKDSSYCNMDAGILISNSVLQAMKEHLDWCVMNAATDDHSENLGRCIYHSTKLECQEEVQGQRVPTHKLKNFALNRNFERLMKDNDFVNAVTVYPVIQKEDYYLLHAYYSKQKLIYLKKEINKLAEDLTDQWPPGERPGSIPATRFDLPRELYFNTTHMFHQDDITLIARHRSVDLDDIKRVLDHVKAKVEVNYPEKYEFRRLINGYRKFDLSRGLDYKLDIGFRDLHTGKEVIKRFEVCKPLGNVEVIPAPYVTENNRITILLPVQEHETDKAISFVDNFSRNIMDNHEKVFLMFVFLYQYNSTSKGKDDVFAGLKDFASKSNTKYHSEDTKIAWVSIRLPYAETPVKVETYQALNFAIIDLSLKKIGLESIVLVLGVYTDVGTDFLNRVRMNTVANFQIFSAIPFRFYDPQIAQYDSPSINKNSGHFDSEEYNFISFYGKDYVFARKKSKHIIPLMRGDNDIASIIHDSYKTLGNVFDMFVRFSGDLHCLRAPDKSLKVKFHKEGGFEEKNHFFGTQSQLAKLILMHSDKIQTL